VNTSRLRYQIEPESVWVDRQVLPGVNTLRCDNGCTSKIMTSPASSGPAGPHFEGQVGGSYLLSMLLDVDARGLPGSKIHTIQFQRSDEGNPLDDVIVKAHDHAGNPATLEVQAKRAITFAPKDAVFAKVTLQIKKASETAGFWSSNHQLAIAIARTTERIERSYQDVLTWARNFEISEAFHARLARSGAGNEPMRTFVKTFRQNLTDAGGRSDDESVWRLLRRMQILAFDFTATGSASIELMQERAVRALHSSHADQAGKLWTTLTDRSMEIALNGGERSRDSLVDELKKTYPLAGRRINLQALVKVAEDSRLALLDIEDKISGVRLLREKRIDAVRIALETKRYVEIRGDAGVGKSGVLRHFAEELSTESPILVFSPNRTIPGGWGKFRDSIGYDGTCRELLTDLSLSGSAILFIDNLDFFGPDAQKTVIDFVRTAVSVPGITVIATARADFALTESNWLPKEELAVLGKAAPVFIPDLDDNEVAELREGATRLSQLLSNSHPARSIVRNLFRLSRLVSRDEDQPWPATEAELATQWWAHADGQKDSLLRDRRRVLYSIAEHYLTSIEPYNGRAELSRALDSLIKSGTLRELKLDRVVFRHDVLREWAVANLLAGDPELIPKMALAKRAPSDLERGIELAARISIENAADTVPWLAILSPVNQNGPHDTWRRAVLLSLVRSEVSVRILKTATPVLLAEDAHLLRKLIRYVLAIEFESFGKRAKARGLELNGIPPQLRVPRNSSAMHLIVVLVVIHNHIPAVAVSEAAKLYSAYLMGTAGVDSLTPMVLPHLYTWLVEIDAEHEVNPYGFVNRIFGGKLKEYQLEVLEGELRTSFLLFCNRSPQLASDYLKSFRGRIHAREARASILAFRGDLARTAPKELVDFTIETLIPPNRRKRERQGPLPERAFEDVDVKFQPASPAQGPFLELLLACPEEGLKLIRHLVEYEIRFYREDQTDRWAVPIVLAGNDKCFPWRDFYYWSREFGSASATVVSCLMALEAWAHQRIEAGESIDAVLSEVLSAPSMSCAVLLVATDIVLSHWPQSALAGIPLFASPELLCLEITRDHHDNVKMPDLFGLKDIQKEPIGRATLQSLAERPSRKTNLYKVLSQYTFGPKEANQTLRALLQRASERLGRPYESSDLGDPRQMALHALNAINPDNWVGRTVPQPDGGERPVIVYQEPPNEAKQMGPLREKAKPTIDENVVRIEIQSKLVSTTPCTTEFLDQAFAWASRHESAQDAPPRFDRSGEHSSTRDSVVTAALLIVRDGTPELIKVHGDWARGVFSKTFLGETDPSFVMRTGLAMNPWAAAFVGQCLLLHKDPRQGDLKSLLRFTIRGGYAAAHGFGAAIDLLSTINPLIVPAILRCAFLAAVKLDYGWLLSDEEKEKRFKDHENAIEAAMNEVADWLDGSVRVPAWSTFPVRDAAEDGEKHPRSRPSAHADWQAAAIWLKQAKHHFDPSAYTWPSEIVANYRAWTRDANGAGLEDDDRREHAPREWNEVYFELEARCLVGQSAAELAGTLNSLFSGLSDESYCTCLSALLFSVDRAYFEWGTLTASQAVQVRRYVMERLQQTSLFGWNKDRDELSVEMHLGPALATLCFNVEGFRQSKCYLPPSYIERADVFLPSLEAFVRGCTSPYLALRYLNFMEVAPRAEQVRFVAACAGAWLDRFPDSDRFWIEWEFGQRICSVLVTIFQDAPETFSEAIMPEIERVLSKLVSLGAPHAYELEELLYYGQL
jgi:hypothetical protein